MRRGLQAGASLSALRQMSYREWALLTQAMERERIQNDQRALLIVNKGVENPITLEDYYSGGTARRKTEAEMDAFKRKLMQAGIDEENIK